MTTTVISERKSYSSDLYIRDWQRLEPLLVVKRRSQWPLVGVLLPKGRIYTLSHRVAGMAQWATV